jgi:predicted TIM-barrel fold metal-dependent hydrolase
VRAMKIWANSADSHFLEPEDMWEQILPRSLAERMPRTVKEDDWETVHVDGTTFRRRLPKAMTYKGQDGRTIVEINTRPPGASDLTARVKDLDGEGIWAEVIFPSLGLWLDYIKDPELLRIATRAENEWIKYNIQDVAPGRFVPAAQLSLLSVDDAVAEVEHAANLGLHVVSLPTGLPDGVDDYNRDSWEPLWAAAEDAGIVVAFHVGSGEEDVSVFSGPGGAVLNYVEVVYPVQRIVTKLVCSGALDRHPKLRILIAEGGASWIPSLGDRMEEAYRQHAVFVRPKLARSPHEILYSQVYASFQHDESAVPTVAAMGFTNVAWGADYPHLEGTFGHTQDTLHHLFDATDAAVRERITVGTFRELFPHVDPIPSVIEA